MFRIKNVRNTTVNKQTNISPAVRNPIAPLNRFQNKISNKQPIGQKVSHRIITSKKLNENIGKCGPTHNKVLSKIEPQITAKLKNQAKKQQAPNASIKPEQKNQQRQTQKYQKQNQIRSQQKVNEIKLEQTKTIKEPTKPVNIDPPKIQDKDPLKQEQDTEKQKLEEFIKKEQQARKRALEMQKQFQEEQLQRKKRQQDRERRRQQRRRQEEKQKERELELKKMMEKVAARKKAREEQFERRKKQEQQKKRLSDQHGIGGIISLSDPLAHIEMSQAIMDRQINKLLSMKFANFPNKQEIQHQLQELERINTSYLLCRQDPKNTLIRGLSNFRIELFNRVGQLIMKGQAEIGPQASGLQVIQTDYHQNNAKLAEGVKITRGLQNQVKKLLKTVKLQNQQECAICLGMIPTGQQVYSVKCGHIFHRNCLEQWLTNTANCPACRYNIKYDHY